MQRSGGVCELRCKSQVKWLMLMLLHMLIGVRFSVVLVVETWLLAAGAAVCHDVVLDAR